MTLSSIQIHGAKNTRRSFLDPLLQPLVGDSRNVGYTLADLLNEVGASILKLQKFGMIKMAAPLTKDMLANSHLKTYSIQTSLYIFLSLPISTPLPPQPILTSPFEYERDLG